KKTAPGFPIAGEVNIDPRLLEQEKRGRTLGEVQQIDVRTIAGLQFEPSELRVQRNKLVALKVINTDESFPHNLVLVRPDRLNAVGEGSMKLASDPEGADRHYVIDDEGIIALSPMLSSGSHYTIYFKAPSQPGAYPFICTFPGHWQVTRGELVVE
ncbi:MAG: plastocyanin/azurin family copper-binding protein, partial [Verrucomicrobiota bacterium]